MNFSKVHSAQVNMLQAYIVDIETDITKNTLNSFTLVGLANKAVEESRDRVSSAIKNSGFKSPKEKNQKVITSLAPANLKKEGPNFDLGIAVGYLLASENIAFEPAPKIFLGELTLDGHLRQIDGVLPLVQEAKQKGFTEIYLPIQNAEEAALIRGVHIYGIKKLTDLIAHFNREKQAEDFVSPKLKKQPPTQIKTQQTKTDIDLADVKGQETAKRGLAIAAAGGHNMAMYGPPGTGKTMLAKAFCGIIPALSFEEMLETTAIHSVAGVAKGDLITQPPFRSPHHTVSYVSLVGGGTIPKPGEVTLAHKGVLFLDEFPEFEKRAIEALRQPLEDNIINISRAKGSATFPANFILIATMNPCPCGNYGTAKECTCSPAVLLNYQRKISGPIMDRIDMWIEVSDVDYTKLADKKDSGKRSSEIQEKIIQVRNIQNKRFKNTQTCLNSEMSAKDLNQLINLDKPVQDLLNQSAKKLELSARVYHKIIKLAQTIADLEEAKIKTEHILEALQYRPKKNLNNN